MVLIILGGEGLGEGSPLGHDPALEPRAGPGPRAALSVAADRRDGFFRFTGQLRGGNVTRRRRKPRWGAHPRGLPHVKNKKWC